ncbi:hypothetical protein BXZ70DRAFT_1012762 [Cristinia sonorae]|uniref:Uncharacterized protein n=1 Tax=Cristinia sonorae TaxID=1940300 RepID=A0A8K0XK23_9AGAR|nr:hypothetical protein BXZ70DRAFT_1012762 [Cristinia sonorae]
MDTIRLIREIESVAQSSARSSVGSSAGTSTIPGIGMVSGRVIKAVGSLAVRGVEIANIHARLRWIAMQLRAERKHIPETFCEDIMELQRIDLYSKHIRKQAWELIFLLLELRQSAVIARVLSRWECVELRLFLSQLEACRRSGWRLDISRVGLNRTKSKDPLFRGHHDLSDQATRLTDGFCDLVLAIFTQDSSTLHESLGNTLAWDLVLLLLEKKRFKGITSAMERWPSKSCRRFLLELAICMLTSWDNLPDGRRPIIDDVLQTFPRHPDRTLLNPRAECLTESFRGFLFEISMEHPEMLTEAFTLEQFAALQSYYPLDEARRPFPGDSPITYFLHTLQNHPLDDAQLLRYWMLPLRAMTFVKFTCAGDASQLHTVIQRLICTIRDASPQDRYLQPLLCFALHLVSGSSAAAVLAYELGLLDALDHLTALHDHHLTTTPSDVRFGCIAILSALGSHVAVESLAETAAHATSVPHVRGMFKILDDMADQTIHHFIQVQWLALSVPVLHSIRSLDLSWISPSQENPWSALLAGSIFLTSSNQDSPLESVLAWSTSLAVFSCISHPKTHWQPLIKALTGMPVHDLHAMLSYILSTFIRIPGPHPVISKATRTALTRLQEHSASFGLTLTNPMDRFLLFLNLVTRQTPSFTFALYCAGAYELVSEVHDGVYDFCTTAATTTGGLGFGSGSGPAPFHHHHHHHDAAQKRIRTSLCVELHRKLVACTAVPAHNWQLVRAPIGTSPSTGQSSALKMLGEAAHGLPRFSTRPI